MDAIALLPLGDGLRVDAVPKSSGSLDSVVWLDTAAVVRALPCHICPITRPSVAGCTLHQYTVGLNT